MTTLVKVTIGCSAIVFIAVFLWIGTLPLPLDNVGFEERARISEEQAPYKTPEALAAKRKRASRNVDWDKVMKEEQQKYAKKNRFEAIMQARLAIKQNLKAPSTAKWVTSPNSTSAGCKGRTWYVVCQVDAQNRFGAMLRNTFEVQLYHNLDNSWDIESIIML